MTGGIRRRSPVFCAGRKSQFFEFPKHDRPLSTPCRSARRNFAAFRYCCHIGDFFLGAIYCASPSGAYRRRPEKYSPIYLRFILYGSPFTGPAVYRTPRAVFDREALTMQKYIQCRNCDTVVVVS